MIPGHPRTAGDRQHAARELLRPRHHLHPAPDRGPRVGLAILVSLVLYAIIIAAALHVVALVMP
jgi:hypothetical protein